MCLHASALSAITPLYESGDPSKWTAFLGCGVSCEEVFDLRPSFEFERLLFTAEGETVPAEDVPSVNRCTGEGSEVVSLISSFTRSKLLEDSGAVRLRLGSLPLETLNLCSQLLAEYLRRSKRPDRCSAAGMSREVKSQY